VLERRATATAAPSWSEARRIARGAGAASPAGIVERPLATAAGSMLAADAVATAPLPGTDASAMDGWALGGLEGPWRIGAPIPMGSAPATAPLGAGLARPVTTGGPLPRGTAAVLRLERGRIEHGLLHADRAVAEGGDLRRAGEEARPGETLVRGGTRLAPAHLALLAAAGYDAVRVRRAPTAALLVLGDEVVVAGAPAPGTVRDVFGPSAPGVIEAGGGRLDTARQVPDDLDAVIAALGSSAADIVITTGGTSLGGGDQLRPALRSLGARFLLAGVLVRPGHPVTLAQLPDGRPVLGLPGNPLAGLLCLVGLGGAVLDGMLGRAHSPAPLATVAGAIANPSGSTRLVACAATAAGLVETGFQRPGMLRGLADADAIAVVPPGGVLAGAAVETLPLPW
jgi:molybdopterin molybdotransferase